ncbi:MAG: glycosyltransferase [Hyphomicrobium sp.]
MDWTHVRRRASGLERIACELFSPAALAPLSVRTQEAGHGRLSMAARQMLVLPAAAVTTPHSVWVFPGYPPSPLFSLLRERAIFYVHDLFLMTRARDLNSAARAYMAKPFHFAVRHMRYFLANSVTTAAALSAHTAPDAVITLYRPEVRDVFGLALSGEREPGDGTTLVIGCIGTIEPRKNFLAAARIRATLSERLNRPVELHIVGREGWGGDYCELSGMAHVRLHGFLADDAAAAVIRRFDILLCSSEDEGLGLPLLEVQHGGVAVVAPGGPVFHEVLGASGTFIDPSQPDAAANTIMSLIGSSGWRARSAQLARANIANWNARARDDRARVIELMSELLRKVERKGVRGAECPS